MTTVMGWNDEARGILYALIRREGYTSESLIEELADRVMQSGPPPETDPILLEQMRALGAAASRAYDDLIIEAATARGAAEALHRLDPTRWTPWNREPEE